MTINYKDDMKKFSKEELIERAPVTPDIVEKHEVERLDGIHLTDINGPDGVHEDFGFLEVKSQRWRGNSPLWGRAKFSGISEANHKRKSKENELIIAVGYHEGNGTLFYRFTFNFSAIADRYADSVEKSKSKNWTNFDAIPHHYKDHESFNVEYVANGKVLEENSEAFRPGFYDYLQSFNSTTK